MVGLLGNFFSHNKDFAAIADSFVFSFSFAVKVRVEKKTFWEKLEICCETS